MRRRTLSTERTQRLCWLLVGSAVLVLGSFPLPALAARTGGSGCPTARPTPQIEPTVTTILTPADSRTKKPPSIDFGRSRSFRDLAPYSFTVTSGPAPDVRKLGWDLDLVSGNAGFPSSGASVRFYYRLDRLKVDLCLSATGRPAGLYSGSLRIAGAGVRPIEIPLTVTLKDTNALLILIGLFVASVIALLYKWALENVAEGSSFSKLFSWLREHWLAAIVAVVGGAGAVYYKQYLNNPSFVAADRFSLWLAAGAAVLTASVLTTAGHKAVQRRRSEASDRANGRPAS